MKHYKRKKNLDQTYYAPFIHTLGGNSFSIFNFPIYMRKSLFSFTASKLPLIAIPLANVDDVIELYSRQS